MERKYWGRLAWTAIAGIALLLAAGTADACSRAKVSGTDRVIPGDRIDQALFSAAVTVETNYQRCRAGRHALENHGGLMKVATTHSKYMAKSGQVQHNSTVRGQNTVKTRLSASGLRWRAGSENIGMVHRYRIDEGRAFFLRAGAGSCGFTTSDGRTIPPHTYASLAQRMVKLWMDSPSHRRNLLDSKVKRVGSGVTFDGSARNCGRLFVAQDFAG